MRARCTEYKLACNLMKTVKRTNLYTYLIISVGVGGCSSLPPSYWIYPSKPTAIINTDHENCVNTALVKYPIDKPISFTKARTEQATNAQVTVPSSTGIMNTRLNSHIPAVIYMHLPQTKCPGCIHQFHAPPPLNIPSPLRPIARSSGRGGAMLLN